MESSERNVAILAHIDDYSDLKVLLIGCFEDLQSLPESIGKLTEWEELTVAYGHGNGCSMNPVLPETIGNLRSLGRLILYGAVENLRRGGLALGVERELNPTLAIQSDSHS